MLIDTTVSNNIATATDFHLSYQLLVLFVQFGEMSSDELSK